MWFDMVTVPFRQPNGPGFLRALDCFVSKISWIFPWLVLGSFVGAGRWRFREQRLAEWVRGNPWVLFFWCGLWLVPTSFKGLMITGGSANSMHCLYFWAVALSLLVVANAREPGPRTLTASARLILVVFALISLALASCKGHIRLARELPDYTNNVHEQSFRYARAHPGEAYFPWDTLATAMAERRIYHAECGPGEMQLAGEEVVRDQLASNLPPKLRLIAYGASQRHRRILGFLPEFDTQTTLPELPGYDVFVIRPGASE
jgi:hypothetical protein